MGGLRPVWRVMASSRPDGAVSNQSIEEFVSGQKALIDVGQKTTRTIVRSSKPSQKLLRLLDLIGSFNDGLTAESSYVHHLSYIFDL